MSLDSLLDSSKFAVPAGPRNLAKKLILVHLEGATQVHFLIL